MKKIFFGLLTLVFVTLGIWLFVELSTLFNYNSDSNSNFMEVSFHNLISITISAISILINIVIAIFVAYYLNQQRTDSRRVREHSEKIISDLRTQLWELIKIVIDDNVNLNEELLLCTRCDNKLESIKKLQKYIKSENYQSLNTAWEEISEFLGWSITLTEEKKKSRQADILKIVNKMDKVCDDIITNLWLL